MLARLQARLDTIYHPSSQNYKNFCMTSGKALKMNMPSNKEKYLVKVFKSNLSAVHCFPV